MNLLLLAIVTVSGLALLWPKRSDKRQMLEALPDGSELDSRFTGNDRLAINSFRFAAANVASLDVLQDFASALFLANAVSNEWANAYAEVGRGDIAKSMVELLVNQ